MLGKTKDETLEFPPHLLPQFPNVPARVAEEGRLIQKEIFLENFDMITELYELLATPVSQERNEKLFPHIKQLEDKINHFDFFAIMAIYGAFSLYNHPEKDDKLSQTTLKEAKNKSHPNHAMVREWIWGLHWSLLHTMGGPDSKINTEKFTRRLTDHLFTALNGGWVLDAKTNEVPPNDHKLRPLFDKSLSIAKNITEDSHTVVLKSYLDYEAYRKLKNSAKPK